MSRALHFAPARVPDRAIVPHHSVLPAAASWHGNKMGIKFLCPNGHKLHVKSFLTGKRAICPKCGARVIVPAEDCPRPARLTRPASDESGRRGAAVEDSSVASRRSILDRSARRHRSPLRPPATSAATDAAARPTRSPRPRRGLVRAPGDRRPVRPGLGRDHAQWINDGRVGASSLVWRAGWTEWRRPPTSFRTWPRIAAPRRGTAVDGHAAAAGSALPPGTSSQCTSPGHAAPTSLPRRRRPRRRPLPHAVRRRRRRNDVSLIASAVLIVYSVILVIVLVLVFRAQRTPVERIAEPGDRQLPRQDLPN